MKGNNSDYENCEEEARIIFEKHCEEVRNFTSKYWGDEYNEYRNKGQKEMRDKFFEDLKALRKSLILQNQNEEIIHT